jgi:release factor glutamine methyltransferase
MTDDAPWTVGRLLNWTTDFLRGKGSDSPRLDAEVLLAAARGCERIELYTAFDEEPAEEIRQAFRELVSRRANGTPVAYLVGKREFFSLSFDVTPDVLIPRTETELLVVRALDLNRTLAVSRIADVGTGSGILAVCAAKYLPRAQVTAIDISPAALDVARRNAQRHGVAERIRFAEGDLLSAESTEPHFDFVVSNPPYVSTTEMAELPADVQEYEPQVALHAGERGTEVIERLVEQAVERLRPGGALILEVSPMIAGAVEQLICDHPPMNLGPTVRDLAGHPRVVQATKP